MELSVASVEQADSVGGVSSLLCYVQLRLDSLRSNMEMCRAAMGKWHLNPYRSHAARILIEEMERSVESLRTELPANPMQSPPRPAQFPTIEENLDHLDRVCRELMGIVFPTHSANTQLAS